MAEKRTDAEERAEWSSWLDRFDRDIWPVFERRGYTKNTAALIYFTRFPEDDPTADEEREYPF